MATGQCFVYVVLALCLLGLSAVEARRSRTLDPVPKLLKPLIVDPTAPDTPEEQASLDQITSLLGKEPESANAPPPVDSDEEEEEAESGSDSESGSESSASGVASATGGDGPVTATDLKEDPKTAAILTEIAVLEKLIGHGDEILKALPTKKARLDELKAKLEAAAGERATQHAQKKLTEQQGLLSEIDEKIAGLETKLTDLKDTKAKLEASIAEVQKTINGGAQEQGESVASKVTDEIGDAAAAEVKEDAAPLAAETPAAFLEEYSQ
jgi:hypothetical protein